MGDQCLSVKTGKAWPSRLGVIGRGSFRNEQCLFSHGIGVSSALHGDDSWKSPDAGVGLPTGPAPQSCVSAWTGPVELRGRAPLQVQIGAGLRTRPILTSSNHVLQYYVLSVVRVGLLVTGSHSARSTCGCPSTMALLRPSLLACMAGARSLCCAGSSRAKGHRKGILELAFGAASQLPCREGLGAGRGQGIQLVGHHSDLPGFPPTPRPPPPSRSRFPCTRLCRLRRSWACGAGSPCPSHRRSSAPCSPSGEGGGQRGWQHPPGLGPL